MEAVQLGILVAGILASLLGTLGILTIWSHSKKE